MCRLLGVVSSEPVSFRLCLEQAPRSVAVLSREHSDGWGVAVFDENSCTLQKAAVCADTDRRFHEFALGARGVLMLAHIRKRTVGECSPRNTHPFCRRGWVFAHNGTIEDTSWLSNRTPPAHLAEVEGDTDSERLFAFLLGKLDGCAPSDQGAVDAALLEAVGELASEPRLGASTFLLVNASVVYAYRSGRALYLLERRPGDAVRHRRESAETGAVIETPWSTQRSAILVASEQITDEPWREVTEGALLRIDRMPEPRAEVLAPPARGALVA